MTPHPVAVAAESDDVAAVQQPVRERDGPYVVVQDLPLVLEPLVGGQHCREVPVAGEDDLTGDPQTGLFALLLAATPVHANGTMPRDGTWIVCTVDGEPGVVVRFELSVTGEASIAVSGTFDDGRCGSCGIDADIATALDEAGASVTLTGEACGPDVMESEPGLFDI